MASVCVRRAAEATALFLVTKPLSDLRLSAKLHRSTAAGCYPTAVGHRQVSVGYQRLAACPWYAFVPERSNGALFSSATNAGCQPHAFSTQMHGELLAQEDTEWKALLEQSPPMQRSRLILDAELSGRQQIIAVEAGDREKIGMGCVPVCPWMIG